MSDAGFELRPWVSLPMGLTFERASERAVRRGFDDRGAHPSGHGAARCAMIRRGDGDIVQRLALAMLALLAVAAPAGAAEVARVEGGVLDAREHRQAGFCLRLTQARSAFGGGGTSTCGRAPWRPRRSTLLTWPAGRDRVLAAGAVPASVVRAEAELVDGRRIGFRAEYLDEGRGIFVSRLFRHCPPDPI